MASDAPSDITGTINALGTTAVTDSGPVAAIDRETVAELDSHDVLLVVRGPGSGSRIALTGETLRAGRSPECEIFLDDITVSREHARIALTGDAWTIADLGSLNGTYVNRSSVDQVALSDGDEIQIGKYRFHFLRKTSGEALS